MNCLIPQLVLVVTQVPCKYGRQDAVCVPPVQQFRNWLKAIFQEEETCLYVHRSITKSLGARNKHVFNIKYHCARQASTVSIIQFLEAACPSVDTCYIEQSQTASRDGQNKGTLISSNSLS